MAESIRRPPVIVKYGAAVLSMAVALDIARWMQIEYAFEPLVPFLCVIMFSAWFGGDGPGLLAVVLSMLAFHYFIIPLYPSGVEKEMPRLFFAALTALFIVRLSVSQRKATDSLKQAVKELKQANELLRAENAEHKRTQEALQQSELRFGWLVEVMPIAVYVCDQSGVIQAYNKKCVELWGREPKVGDKSERYCGSLRLYSPDGKLLLHHQSKIEEVLRTGVQANDWEVVVERPDGSRITALANISPLRNNKGELIGVVNCVLDISSRKRAEKAVWESEKKFSKLFQSSPIAVSLSTINDGRYLDVNNEFLRMVQRTRDEVIGHTSVEIGIWADLKQRAENIAEIREQGAVRNAELEIRGKSGQITDILWSAEALAIGGENCLLGSSVDITERKRVQEAMKESQKLLNLVLATLPVGVVVMNQSGDVILNNEASKRIWGGMITAGRERLAQSKGFWHDSGKQIAPENWASARALSKGQTSLNELIDIETLDGKKKTIQNSAAPIRNAEGKIVGAVIVIEDVTERVCAEQALKRAEDNLRFVLDTTPAMIHTARPDGYLDYFNNRWLDYVGLPMESLMGWGWTTVVHPDDIDGEVNRWRACVSSGEPFECEVRARRADGKYRWVLHRKVAMRDDRGNIVKWYGSAIDIDDRRRAEQMLRDSHAQLRALSARVQSVREEEAARIAREIHDDLGQKLTGLKMDLRRAERKIEAMECTPAVNSLLDTLVSATELVDGITGGVQEIAANLRPEILDKLGLSEALHYEGRRFQERTGISCMLHLPEIELNLSETMSTALFRLFQECLTNIARHADATQVEAALKLEDGQVILSVHDNGRGITEDAISNPESLGLLGMKERTALLGGEIVFHRNPKGGTIVTVRIAKREASTQRKEDV
jgi:PAS domain S-box-containing protein